MTVGWQGNAHSDPYSTRRRRRLSPRPDTPWSSTPQRTSPVTDGRSHPVGASLFGFDPEALSLGYARCLIVAPTWADPRIPGTASDAVDDGDIRYIDTSIPGCTLGSVYTLCDLPSRPFPPSPRGDLLIPPPILHESAPLRGLLCRDTEDRAQERYCPP